MSLWKRGIEKGENILKSDELVKKRSELIKMFPEVQKKWEEQDKVVLQMAGELSVAQYAQNFNRLQKARENLKKSLWARDGAREEFQREIDRLNTEIESLNISTIFEKSEAWRKDLSLLRSKKSVEKIKRLWHPEKGYRIRYRSNLAVIEKAKERLSGAIFTLREMRWSGLGEILEFIKKIETELQMIDFAIMGDEKEVSEWRYLDIVSEPGLKKFEIARLEPGLSTKNLVVQKSGEIQTESAFGENE
jgi:hypothetical protein